MRAVTLKEFVLEEFNRMLVQEGRDVQIITERLKPRLVAEVVELRKNDVRDDKQNQPAMISMPGGGGTRAAVWSEEEMSNPKKSYQQALKEFEEKLERAGKPKVEIEAVVLPFPPKLSEQELCRRQRIIDATWERVLAERQELEAEAARCCHRGSGEPDWWR